MKVIPLFRKQEEAMKTGFCKVLMACVLGTGCNTDIQPVPAKVTPKEENIGKRLVETTAEPAIGTKNASSTATNIAQAANEDDNLVTILAWNVESGGADPRVIATQLSVFSKYDIFCLSEVHPDDFETYRMAAGPDFESICSKSGNEDRLQILFDKSRFELLQSIELTKHGDYVLNNDRHRSPTAARLREKRSNKTFIVMVNHLARGNAEFRTTQAIGLREWARDQNVGIINVGDFNMDYVFETQKGNEALDAIRQDNIWTWIEPEEWIDSNWWDPENDGIDNFEGSLLDLVFVAGEAKEWKPSCKVLVRDKDFPDDETTSDHRPVHAQFSLQTTIAR